MTPGACQCVPGWTGERHQWSCLKAHQLREPAPAPCACSHAKEHHDEDGCTWNRCPCTRYAPWATA